MANLVTFVKKLWKDATSGGTPITAAELNRMEGGINDCATQINKLGDSVSPLGYQNPCEVLFINNDGQFGIQITDKATGNMGFITIKKDSTIYANVRINNVWGTERHL